MITKQTVEYRGWRARNSPEGEGSFDEEGRGSGVLEVVGAGLGGRDAVVEGEGGEESGGGGREGARGEGIRQLWRDEGEKEEVVRVGMECEKSVCAHTSKMEGTD